MPVLAAWLPRVAVGVSFGVGCGLLLVGGWMVETLVALALIPVLLGIVRSLEPAPERRSTLTLALLAFGLRLIAIAALQLGSTARGMDGFITGDDREYFTVSWSFVQFLRGTPQPPYVPPYWAGSAYIFGAWVYLESALLWVVGPRVIVPIIVNASFSVVSALLVGDMARNLFGDRVGKTARFCVAFYPSLVLWSVLNLKDSLTLLLITLTLWSLLRFARRPAWWPLALALAMLIPLQTLRAYIFSGLALIVPLAVLVAPRLPFRARATWAAPALLVCGCLMVANHSGVSATTLIASSEGLRNGMAVNARTAFQPTPTPVPRIFSMVAIVPTAAPEPEAPLFVITASREEPVATSRQIVTIARGGVPAPPAARGNAPAPAATAEPHASAQIATPESTATPAPVRTARPIPLSAQIATPEPTATPAPVRTARPIPLSVRLEPAFPPPRVTAAPQLTGPTGPTPAELTMRTISYLPKGAMYALFAPWPWLSSRAIDLVTAPEMLFWYAALSAMMAALWAERRRWHVLLPIALFAFGTLGVFALVEGNWGTLYRHRAMTIPFVILLAAPVLAAWTSVLSLRRPRR